MSPGPAADVRPGGRDGPADRAAATHRARLGHGPARVWAAPGRVNLIGEHTDYNDGFVLPFALPQRTAVAASMTPGPHWTVWSEAAGEAVQFGPEGLHPGAVSGWAGYVAGVVWVLTRAGVAVPAAELTLASDVPIGAGLSSSAAIECATLAVLLDLSGARSDWPLAQWPALAQRAENAYAGVPCGIMDQSAATLCQRDHALFLDCRTGEFEQVPLPLAEAGLTLLVIDTRAPHQHADNEYADRRASCERAARLLGLPALRDVTDPAAALAALSDDVTRRRVRHVLTENERVHQTVALLRAGHPERIGGLLTASHASLRDDFEVSAAELDLAVDTALAAGALGARMTGGGFGGCAIALVPTPAVASVTSAVGEAFAAHRYAEPMAFAAVPGPGVEQVG